MKGIFGRKGNGGRDEERRRPSAKVFGVPLNDVCAREQADVPLIAEETIEYLEKRLTVEGMFRVPGSAVLLDQLRAYYDGEGDGSVTVETCEDVHAVACLLKLYLRELPDPVLTHRFYDTFIAVQKNQDPQYRMSNVRKLVSALPIHHKHLLTRLIDFLVKVAAHAETNKMSEANLAIVFGPNLLRPRHESMLRMIEDARHVNAVIRALIEESEYLVTCTAEQPKSLTIDASSESSKGDSAAAPVVKMVAHPSMEVVDYDLARPLAYASRQLERMRTSANRPADVDHMSNVQLREEKAAVKRVLRNFDIAFKSLNGVSPNKQEKEPLRPLYDRYRSLSKLVEQLGAESSSSKEAAAEEQKEELSYEELKKEKRSLQYRLHQYQQTFEQRYGRKVQFLEDRLPVQREYSRYKELKALLERMEAAGAGGPNSSADGAEDTAVGQEVEEEEDDDDIDDDGEESTSAATGATPDADLSADPLPVGQ